MRPVSLLACPLFMGIASCCADAPYRRVLVEPHGFQQTETFQSAPGAHSAICLPSLGRGCVMVSNTNSGSGRDDVCIAAIDERGALVWSRTLGGRTVRDACRSRDGGYAVATTTRSRLERGGLFAPPDTILTKIDANGSEAWSRIIKADRNTSVECESVLHTRDGGYAITGAVSEPHECACLIKTDGLGNVLWSRAFDALALLSSALETADGEYIVTGGISCGPDSSKGGLFALKTDSLGRTMWSRSFAEDPGVFRTVGVCSHVGAVQCTADGGYVVAGLTYSREDGSDIRVAMIDAIGRLKWSTTVGGEGDQLGVAIATTADGGCIVAGSTDAREGTRRDALLVNLDRDGKETWSRILEGADFRHAVAIQQTAEGGLSLLCEECAAGNDSVRFGLFRLARE